MPVNCPKCSRPILVTDVIESFDRRLSHLDCARPHGLRPEERALIFVYCSGHPVAHCAACNVGFGFTELASDILGGRTNLCPRCRTDLTESVRGHLFTCMTLPSEIRQRTQDVRDAAQRLIKQSQQAVAGRMSCSERLTPIASSDSKFFGLLRAAMTRRAAHNK